MKIIPKLSLLPLLIWTTDLCRKFIPMTCQHWKSNTYVLPLLVADKTKHFVKHVIKVVFLICLLLRYKRDDFILLSKINLVNFAIHTIFTSI